MVNVYFEISEKLFTSKQFIAAVGNFALSKLKIPDVEITIIIVSNEKIRKLNKKHMNSNNETDVLSFNLGYHDPESDLEYLGDIVISGEKADEQAREFGHTVEKEMAILITHGILHLIGYEDQNIDDKTVMFKIQDLIIQDFFKVN